MSTFKTILCPTDFSEPSSVAFDEACKFASHYGAELVLMHVIPFPAPNDLGLATEQEAERYAQLEAECALRELSDDCPVKCGTVRHIVRVGDATGEIVGTAKRIGADLIVMATHGRTGWRHLVFGSVTEAVLRIAPCPVITIRAHTFESSTQPLDDKISDGAATDDVQNIKPESGATLAFKKVLCPIDYSEPSYRALKVAAELAAHYDAELLVVNVVESPADNLDQMAPIVFNLAAREQAARNVGLRKLWRCIEAHLPRIRNAHALIQFGNPAAEIVKVACDEGADVVVMSTHGMSGWRHLLIGSTAEQVMRMVACPVLTVRQPLNDHADAHVKDSQATVAIKE